MHHRSSFRGFAGIAGFSMIEMLVTITLAALLVGIAVPSFKGIMANNRLVTQANDFVGAINFARSEAITRNTNIVLCRAASAAATTCASSLATWTNWIVRNTAATEVVRRGVINSHNGTVKVSSNFSLDTVTFGSDGLARTGGALVNDARITVCTSSVDSNNFRVVELGASSRISTTKSTGTC